MSDPLIRGAVVLRRGRFGVVWGVSDQWLVLLPVVRPLVCHAYDIALDLADLVACGVTIPDAVIRPRPGGAVAADGHVQVGMVPGRTMCRVSHGLARVAAEALQVEKWSGAGRHRERCVNLAAASGAAPGAAARTRVVFRTRSEPGDG